MTQMRLTWPSLLLGLLLLAGTAAAAAAYATAAVPGDDAASTAAGRYADEGYRLVGAAAVGAFEPEASLVVSKPAAPASASPPPPSLSSGSGGNGMQLMSLSEVLPPPQQTAAVAGVRRSRDGWVFELQQAAAAAAFQDVKSAFAAAAATNSGALSGYAPPAVAAVRGSAAAAAAAAADDDATAQLLARMMATASPAGRRRLSYVIGIDERTEVPADAGWPFTAVGQVLHERGSCTGVMIGPRAFLTASHCVFNRKLRVWQSRLVFVPFRHRDPKTNAIVEPFGRHEFESVTTFRGWVDPSATASTAEAIRYDLAVVRLQNASVGLSTGWVGMRWDKDRRALQGAALRTMGYAGDKSPRGSLWTTECQVSRAPLPTGSAGTSQSGGNGNGNRGNSSDAYRLQTDCDIAPGQSGSPMFDPRGGARGEPVLRALVSFESCRCCSDDCSCCIRSNGAVPVTGLHLASVQAWR